MKRIGLRSGIARSRGRHSPASAQDKYPSKPVKIVVPYAPGGATDITSRLFGEQMRQSLGQQFVVENKPGAFGILRSRKWPGRGPTATRCSSATSRPMRSRRSCSRRSSRSTSRRTWCRCRGWRSIRPSCHHHGEFRRQDACTDVDRLRQEESRQGPLHQRRRRQLPAFRHGDLRPARRSRHDPHPEQDRRRRHDQRPRGRRRAGRVPQRRELGVDDQGRQAAAGRGARRDSAWPTIPTCRPWRRPASRASAPCTGRACWHRPLRRRRCWRRSSRRSSTPRRCRSCRRHSPSSSSASSPTIRWRRRRPGSRASSTTWRKITTEVKIDLTD